MFNPSSVEYTYRGCTGLVAAWLMLRVFGRIGERIHADSLGKPPSPCSVLHSTMAAGGGGVATVAWRGNVPIQDGQSGGHTLPDLELRVDDEALCAR